VDILYYACVHCISVSIQLIAATRNQPFIHSFIHLAKTDKWICLF